MERGLLGVASPGVTRARALSTFPVLCCSPRPVPFRAMNSVTLLMQMIGIEWVSLACTAAKQDFMMSDYHSLLTDWMVMLYDACARWAKLQLPIYMWTERL